MSAAWWVLIALLASLKLCGSEMFISCMSGFSDVIFPLNYALPVLIWPGFALVLAWFWPGSNPAVVSSGLFMQLRICGQCA